MKPFACIFIGLLLPALATPSSAQGNNFQLISPSFSNNGDIPKQYTCEGGDVNPPLTFKNVPSAAKSLVLTVSDPDAPEGTWSHWVVYNISPNMTDIIKNTNPGTEGLNDFGKYAYGGPCPPNERPHHYIFRLFALNTFLIINEGPTLNEVERAIKGHIISETKLVGIYQKSSP
ncbi:MAG: YbhB/YbcL family Raf kinase inhibitor-like protein [Candidatus Omnitrophica bacterium]|nr:YbhB/YbcL family Raf kinase inhibitor-like protein [Candidatus Omnitrophota bacterium]